MEGPRGSLVVVGQERGGEERRGEVEQDRNKGRGREAERKGKARLLS